MKNIFANAYFGKIYVSSDGTKHTFCSFTKDCSDTLARLYRESWGVVIVYLDGHIHSGGEFGKGIDFTIVSEWQEEISEEKMNSVLDEAERLRETAKGRKETGGWYWRKWAEWGYRKAKEDKE